MVLLTVCNGEVGLWYDYMFILFFLNSQHLLSENSRRPQQKY